MEKQKRFFSIIDITIIFIIVAIIAGIFLRSYYKEMSERSQEISTAEYTVEIKSTNKRFRSLLHSGDKLYFNDNSHTCGTITNVTPSVCKTEVTTADGTKKEEYDQTKIDILLTVEAPCRSDAGGVYIDSNVFIAAGKQLDLHSKTFEFSGTIKNVRIKEMSKGE